MDPIYIAYTSLVVMALIPIYVGSLRSEKEKKVESLTSKDAYMFPLYGSCALLGLYVVFKLVAAHIVNMLLTCYFVLLATAAVASVVRPVMQRVHVVLAGIVGVGVAVAYLFTKHWILNNIIGICFALSGVEYLGLSSFKVGAILLCGLFFYDIFWVFGTEVMVSVATKFDAPIKVLFPRNIFDPESKHAMLGLGDIVIPGIFLALMYRFDCAQSRKRAESTVRKTYFHSCFVAYILGLVVCIGIMQVFKAAQPALLYLVPACLGSVLLVAVAKGELSDLMAYEEEKAAEPEGEADLPFMDQVKKAVRELFLGPAPEKVSKD
jgi:minor histocompatibility antigen H13|uniref:Signal peptide peptidase n=1 Tax=Eutreptiella gymnastica TaxID=73025 RepID=A0A7S4FYJ2_9EUGL